MKCTLRRIAKDNLGTVATTVGIAAVPLMVMSGVAIDYSVLSQVQSRLQASADAAALAGAKELGLTTTNDEALKNTARNYVIENLVLSANVNTSNTKLMVNPTISNDRKSLTVDIDYYWTPFLLHLVNKKALPIRITATASLAGDENICVVALDPSSSASLAMTGASKITANNCSIYSNSASPTGVSAVSSATMTATNTYSAGGYSGSDGSYYPRPITDSPTIDDPLDSRKPPFYNACNHTDKMYLTSETLNPGVYCGGISIKGKVKINLKPGTYIIKDGPLAVSGNASLIGDGVGFYFTGTDAVFDFGVSTQVSISAQKTGAMAGLLFYEDRSSPIGRDFVIRSKDAEKFEGTVYLPKGKLIVDKESRVGQLSDWTAIVARQIEIKKGPQLEINADYANSTIPVPEGVGPTGTVPRLSQ